MVAMVDALHSGYMNLLEGLIRNKNEKKPFQIKWKILKKCKPYNNINKK